MSSLSVPVSQQRALLQMQRQQAMRQQAVQSRPSPGVPLRAVKVQAFSAASPDALATAVNAWITANSQQRTMLALTYHVAAAASGGGGTFSGNNPGTTSGTFSAVTAATTYTAFLTYTE